MSESSGSLTAAANITFSTKAEEFARIAAEWYEAGRLEVPLDRLTPAQWGAIHAIVCHVGAEACITAELTKHIDQQIKKAWKKDSVDDAAVLEWLKERLRRLEGRSREEFAEAAAAQTRFWGSDFPEEQFFSVLHRRALVYVLGRLIRAAKIQSDVPDLYSEMSSQLTIGGYAE